MKWSRWLLQLILRAHKVKSLLERVLGFDDATKLTVLARIIQAGSGMIALVLIGVHCNDVQQGFYFTFLSLIGLQIFFELGINTIIVQFAAHEMPNISLTASGIDGPIKNISRLSSLLRISSRFFVFTCLPLIVILLVAGWIVFDLSEDKSSINVIGYPWLLLVLSTSALFLITPILSFLEGLGLVVEVAKMRLLQYVAYSATLIISLLAGKHIFSLGLASSASATVLIIQLLRGRVSLLIKIWRTNITDRMSFVNEIFPLQLRLAISWISGYLIFQIINPVVFKAHGAVEAGKVGMSLSIFFGISSLTIAWMNTRIPKFSRLIAKGYYNEANRIFFQTLKQIIGIYLFLVFIIFMGLFSLKFIESTIRSRLLTEEYMGILALMFLGNQIVASMAAYLRCHKKEPMMVISVLSGVLSVCALFITTTYSNDSSSVIIGLAIVNLFVTLPSTIVLFRKKVKEYAS
jgi:O-antigen/teichoic acid export membrane protein